MVPTLQDDASIPDDAKLLRRIHPDWVNGARPDGSCFKPDKDPDALGTSVTLWESDVDEENIMRGLEQFGLVVVTMGECRAAGLGIVRTQLDDNPNHCELFGPKAKNARRLLSHGARWRRYPDTVPAELRGPVVELDA